MGVAALAKLLNGAIVLHDSRTGRVYTAEILDVRHEWGKTRIQVTPNGPWFEPTCKELETVRCA